MIVFTGDLHLSDNPRDYYRLRFMKKLQKLLHDMQASGLVIMGDLTEEKDRHSAWLVNRVVEHLHALSQVCPVLIDMGNHDYVSPSDPFFGFLTHLPDVHFVTTPTYSDDLAKVWRNGLERTIILPHTRDYEKDWRGLDMSGQKLILAHNTFDGVDGGSGRKLRGIPRDALPNVTIIAGDVHVPQRHDNLTYVGAPYRVDFGDSYEPRLITLHERMMSSVPLKGFPQKKLVEISNIKDLDDKGLIKGDILKVRVTLSDRTQWKKWRRVIEDWADGGGYVLYQTVVKTTAGENVSRAKFMTEPKHDDEVLRDYGHKMGVDKNTLKVGLSIVDKT